MLFNYFKVAIRNLIREKLYSAINIIGLSTGTAIAILLGLYVLNELSFDRFHSETDRKYRLWVKEHYNGELLFNAATPYILGREVRDNFPEVEQMTRYIVINQLVRRDHFSDQEMIHLVSPNFFDFFNFRLSSGSRESALSALKNIVLTEESARKYFGDENPVGQTITLQISGIWQDFNVSGVAENVPVNSSIIFDFIIPFENVSLFVSDRVRNMWTVVNPETFIMLREGTDKMEFEAKLKPYIDEQVSSQYEPGEYIVGLQPLTEVHLDDQVPAAYMAVGNPIYPWIMAGIAFLILVLAAINFLTLAVGRSLKRVKEVGVRKVSGASRLQIMTQYWSESILTSILAVGLGVLIANFTLPYFNSLTGQNLILTFSPTTVVALFIFGTSLGFLSGLYPSVIVSSFSPVTTVKGSMHTGERKHWLLSGLVGFQFVLSITLIACTLIMGNQLRFLQNKNLGFSKDQIVVLPYTSTPTQEMGFFTIYEEAFEKLSLMKSQLANSSNVIDQSISSHVFGTQGWSQFGYTDPESNRFRQFNANGVDYNYLEMMELNLLEGRNFSEQITTDETNAAIVNETMANTYNLQVGQPMMKPFESIHVIGIVKDYHFESLHNPVAPLVMTVKPYQLFRIASDYNSIDTPVPKLSFKLASGHIQDGIAEIENAWKKVAPDQPFDFTFLDENIQSQYDSESSLGKILSSATLLAILIACLGLFGMASISIGRRTKEIGIRKVMGASMTDIILMLNRQITIMVLLAALIATPITIYLMIGWLRNFAYHVTIGPLVFGLAAVAALLISWISAGYQCMKAARTNPVNSIRYE